MKDKTQYDTIRKLHQDSHWVCANDYRKNYVPYFWKRQAEMEKKGGVRFNSRPCEHGTERGNDYEIMESEPIKIPPQIYREDYLKEKRLELSKIL